MEIFLLIVFIIASYGLSNMVVYSNGPFGVFLKWRELTNRISPNIGELFSCMMCFPFWAGVTLSAIDLFIITGSIFTPFNLLLYFQSAGIIKTILILIMDGIVSSGSVWVLHNIEEYFEYKNQK